MVSSVPTILRSQVRIPITQFTLISICIIEVIEMRKGRNKQKRPGWAHLKKAAYIKTDYFYQYRWWQRRRRRWRQRWWWWRRRQEEGGEEDLHGARDRNEVDRATSQVGNCNFCVYTLTDLTGKFWSVLCTRVNEALACTVQKSCPFKLLNQPGTSSSLVNLLNALWS